MAPTKGKVQIKGGIARNCRIQGVDVPFGNWRDGNIVPNQ